MQICISYEVLIIDIIIYLFFCCVKFFKIKYYKNNLLFVKYKDRLLMIFMIFRVIVVVYCLWDIMIFRVVVYCLRDIFVFEIDVYFVQVMIMVVFVMIMFNSYIVSDICISCKKNYYLYY